MFSSGHILFIFFSAVWIISGTVFLRKKNPPMRKVLLTCLAIAMLSEFIKILGNIEIVPIVEPIVEQGKLIYRETGAYTPYLEAEHFPFELCSYQIIFILLALAVRNPRLQKRLYALMYTTCIAGAGMGILFSSAAIGLTGIRDFVTSILGLQIGWHEECDVRFRDVKGTLLEIVFLDLFTLHVNSMMSTPYYAGETLKGVGKSINYFSSYNNPLGIVMTNKTQWLTYLAVRFVLAVILILLINLPLLRKEKKNLHEAR